jgi:1-pyrroline-5-carboxylate dehydrogenase
VQYSAQITPTWVSGFDLFPLEGIENKTRILGQAAAEGWWCSFGRRMEEAQARVRARLGREYELILGGERMRTADKLKSVNPARPAEVVGVHQKATAELANRAVETAYRNFPAWSGTPAEARIRKLLRTAELIRERRLEFNAWLVFEAGKTWPEAEAEVAEAIDFCEYYAREMARLAGPQSAIWRWEWAS